MLKTYNCTFTYMYVHVDDYMYIHVHVDDYMYLWLYTIIVLLSYTQAQYNLLCRSTEWELLEVCKREGVGMLPWSPLKGY